VKPLDARLLRKFLNLAGQSLKGDWLLVGGTLLPAVGLNVRSTVDIDLIGLGSEEAGQTLELMTLAESLGLSVESINQAAAFFLKKAGYSKSELIVLHKGKKATIFRPSVELYWRLKLPRLSESDLLDCQHYYNFCLGQNEMIRRQKLFSYINQQIELGPTRDKLERLKTLKSLLESGTHP
jgi:hypothetical protein